MPFAIAIERQARLVKNTETVTADLAGEFIGNETAHPVVAGDTAVVTVFHHDHDGVHTPAPYDKEDSPEAPPIQFLGCSGDGIAEGLVGARREEVGT